MSEFANAAPTKKFFLEMLTRDISLEDAILDLVDNCIDSLARHRNLPLDGRLLNERAAEKAGEKFQEDGMARINISINSTSFSIEDNCGGIDYEEAKNDVFRFGRVAEQSRSRLSVYGIGLKRAVFKLGRDITVESHTLKSGFKVHFDSEEWAAQPNGAWQFPLEQQKPARSESSVGTRIEVKKLNADVKMRIGDGQLENRLQSFIGSAYALLLDRFVVIKVNDERVRPKIVPLGTSENAKPGKDEFDVDDVQVTLIAGLAERVNGEWPIDRAGWYVFCNGRIVVSADKTEMTGWGVNAAQFVSKYRGFVGLAFFFSKDPESLPWTTTKRGLNRESRAYLVARNKMAIVAKPVLSFLNNMYASGEVEEPAERQVATAVKSTTIAAAAGSAPKSFVASVARPAAARTVSIQYKVKVEDLEKIRKHLRRSSMSASNVGQHTFKYYLDKECG